MRHGGPSGDGLARGAAIIRRRFHQTELRIFRYRDAPHSGKTHGDSFGERADLHCVRHAGISSHRWPCLGWFLALRHHRHHSDVCASGSQGRREAVTTNHGLPSRPDGSERRAVDARRVSNPGALASSSRSDDFSTPSEYPSIFVALREQVGLNLISKKAPIDFIVIDHLERPSEN